MPSIYLDNNSTTCIHPEVVEAMTACLRMGYVNPASQHQPGRRARRVLEEAREKIGVLLGASMAASDEDQIIFTSGGTESNNLAIRGLVRRPGHVLVSSIEHPSALAAADQLVASGCVIEHLPVSRHGHVEPESLRRMLRDDTLLVCVMMGNNEIGTLQPISELASICTEHNVPMHSDAVQVAGKLPIDFRQLGVTSLAASAHKFHGPRGIGVLVLRHGANLQPLIVGGSQQLGLRPGTESIAAVVGLVRALELYHEAADIREKRMRRLRDLLEQRLCEATKPVVVNGREPRLPHTSNVSFPGLDRQALVMALDLAGVACSTGAACTSGSSVRSHVLVAMDCDPALVDSSIRLSLSALTTESEVLTALDRILAVINDLRGHK